MNLFARGIGARAPADKFDTLMGSVFILRPVHNESNMTEIKVISTLSQLTSVGMSW